MGADCAENGVVWGFLRPKIGRKSPLKILQITDIHFWRLCLNPLKLLGKRFLGNGNVWYKRRHEFLTDQAEGFSDYVAEQNPDLVLITGDFTSTNLPQEFDQARVWVDELLKRGLKLRAIPGNHDVYTFSSTWLKPFEKTFHDIIAPKSLPFIEYVGDGLPLLLVPTVCPNFISSKGRITAAECAETRALIESVEGPFLIAGHYPVLTKTHAYRSGPSRRLRDADALLSIIRETKGPAMYAAGHVHRFSLVHDEANEKLLHLTSGAFVRKAPESGITGDFSEIEYSPDGFTVHRHTFDGAWKRERMEPSPAPTS